MAVAAYPPSRAGLRGQYPSAVEDFAPLREGAFAGAQATAADTGEEYDLVIVGGGISGLAAAYFWRRALPGLERSRTSSSLASIRDGGAITNRQCSSPPPGHFC